MKSIVVATDFSSFSGSALKEGIKLAQILKAQIFVVFVRDTTDLRYALKLAIPIEHATSEELKQDVLRRIQKRFRSFLRRYGRDYSNVEPVVLRGIPWEEILRFARRKKADYLVVGSRGLSPLKTFFVGSTTHNLIRTSQCPVIVVHRSASSRKQTAVA